MNVNIFDITPLLANVKTTIDFPRGRNLLLQDYYCCQNECSKVHDISLIDKDIFQ